MATLNKNLSEYNTSEVPSAQQMKFGIVVADWNAEITHNLLQGALDTLTTHGAIAENINIYHVPGAFELVFACNQIAQLNTVDAIIAIACVIQGDTKHFDFVCQGVTQGIKDINIQTNVPTIFCVLTDNTIEQSRERSGGKHGNKGVEAAITAIKIIAFKQQISKNNN